MQKNQRHEDPAVTVGAGFAQRGRWIARSFAVLMAISAALAPLAWGAAGDRGPVRLEPTQNTARPAAAAARPGVPQAAPAAQGGGKTTAPATNATTAAQLFNGFAGQLTVGRTVSLEDLGFMTPLVFQGAGMEREVFFRVPRGIKLTDAHVQVDGDYMRSSGGRVTLVTLLDGTPIFARDFDSAEGPVDLVVPVKAVSSLTDFIRVGFKFASIAAADWCQDNRSIGNLVNIFPTTRFIYRFDPRDIGSVRDAWVLLPHTTTVLISGEQLPPVQYDAALRLALAIRATGRDVKFAMLPAVGSTVSVANLDIPPALRTSAIFRKFIDSPESVTLDQAADRGAYEVILALSGKSIGDVVIQDGWFRQAINDDMTALRGELQREGGDTAAAFDRWLEKAMPALQTSDPETNLKLEVVLGQPTIVLDTDKANIAAELLADRWYNLARTSALVVRDASVDQTAVDWITLDHLNGTLGQEDIVDHGDWVLSFTAGMLPPGRWPGSLQVDFRVAPDSSNADPVYSISLNDTLLRADRVGEPGGIARATADIPAYLLGASNKLTIGIQRGPLAQDCRYLPHGYAAQVLPTSRLILTDLDLHEQFFGLWPEFARSGEVAVPKSYLASSVESLNFVQTFLYALSFRPTSLQLFVVQDAGSFAPKTHFVAFDLPINATDSGAKLTKSGLVLPDATTTKRVDVNGVGSIALAQMATSNGQQGVLVTTAGANPLPKVKLAALDDGQVVVVDQRGVVVQAGKTWRENAAINRAVNAPAEYGYRYRIWLIAGIVIIAALVLMRIARAIVERRRRRQSGQL